MIETFPTENSEMDIAINNMNAGWNPNEAYKNQRRMLKKMNLSHLYQYDYQPAKYRLAKEYRDTLSYKKKLPNG